MDQPKIRLEGKRKISPEEEKEIPDVEREIPEVSPEETEIAEVSPEESQIPEGSPEETEMPEVSPEETEIPEVSTKEEVELPKVFSEEAIKERPWELFEDSPDEEDEVLKVGPEEENVPEDAHANPRDVYDLCPVNLIDTVRSCHIQDLLCSVFMPRTVTTCIPSFRNLSSKDKHTLFYLVEGDVFTLCHQFIANWSILFILQCIPLDNQNKLHIQAFTRSIKLTEISEGHTTKKVGQHQLIKAP